MPRLKSRYWGFGPVERGQDGLLVAGGNRALRHAAIGGQGR